MTVAVLAVDGGNSKTDVALVAASGTLLATVRGETVSHQVVGAAEGSRRLHVFVDEAHRQAGLTPGPARVGILCLAGADFPSDVRLIRRSLEEYELAGETVILNDCFAPLRAGAEKGWGVVLVCGQGINGAAVAPNGKTARFAGIGSLSGDWGGGGGLGEAALAAAIRGRDGRSPRTSLERTVAAHFGLRTPEQVMLAMYEGRLGSERLRELAPQVFDAAGAGDGVARGLIDRLATELTAMAAALSRRLHLVRLDTDVVLAGGVFNTTDEGFHGRLESGIRAVMPRARLVRPSLPPVAGAALLGLDRVTGAGASAAHERLRRGFRGTLPTES